MFPTRAGQSCSSRDCRQLKVMPQGLKVPLLDLDSYGTIEVVLSRPQIAKLELECGCKSPEAPATVADPSGSPTISRDGYWRMSAMRRPSGVRQMLLNSKS